MNNSPSKAQSKLLHVRNDGASPRTSASGLSPRSYVDEFGVVRKRRISSREKKKLEFLQRQEKAKKSVAVTEAIRAAHNGVAPPEATSLEEEEVAKAKAFEEEAKKNRLRIKKLEKRREEKKRKEMEKMEKEIEAQMKEQEQFSYNRMKQLQEREAAYKTELEQRRLLRLKDKERRERLKAELRKEEKQRREQVKEKEVPLFQRMEQQYQEEEKEKERKREEELKKIREQFRPIDFEALREEERKIKEQLDQRYRELKDKRLREQRNMGLPPRDVYRSKALAKAEEEERERRREQEKLRELARNRREQQFQYGAIVKEMFHPPPQKKHCPPASLQPLPDDVKKRAETYPKPDLSDVEQKRKKGKGKKVLAPLPGYPSTSQSAGDREAEQGNQESEGTNWKEGRKGKTDEELLEELEAGSDSEEEENAARVEKRTDIMGTSDADFEDNEKTEAVETVQLSPRPENNDYNSETAQTDKIESQSMAHSKEARESVQEDVADETPSEELGEEAEDEIQSEKEKAATKIQAGFRGKRDRDRVKSMRAGDEPHENSKEQEEKERAATKIQAKYRGHAQRKKMKVANGKDDAEQQKGEVHWSTEEHEAASRIQRIYRGHAVRKSLEIEEEAILHVESAGLNMDIDFSMLREEDMEKEMERLEAILGALVEKEEEVGEGSFVDIIDPSSINLPSSTMQLPLDAVSRDDEKGSEYTLLSQRSERVKNRVEAQRREGGGTTTGLKMELRSNSNALSDEENAKLKAREEELKLKAAEEMRKLEEERSRVEEEKKKVEEERRKIEEEKKEIEEFRRQQREQMERAEAEKRAKEEEEERLRKKLEEEERLRQEEEEMKRRIEEEEKRQEEEIARKKREEEERQQRLRDEAARKRTEEEEEAKKKLEEMRAAARINSGPLPREKPVFLTSDGAENVSAVVEDKSNIGNKESDLFAAPAVEPQAARAPARRRGRGQGGGMLRSLLDSEDDSKDSANVASATPSTVQPSGSTNAAAPQLTPASGVNDGVSHSNSRVAPGPAGSVAPSWLDGKKEGSSAAATEVRSSADWLGGGGGGVAAAKSTAIAKEAPGPQWLSGAAEAPAAKAQVDDDDWLGVGARRGGGAGDGVAVGRRGRRAQPSSSVAAPSFLNESEQPVRPAPTQAPSSSSFAIGDGGRKSDGPGQERRGLTGPAVDAALDKELGDLTESFTKGAPAPAPFNDPFPDSFPSSFDNKPKVNSYNSAAMMPPAKDSGYAPVNNAMPFVDDVEDVEELEL